VAYWAAAQLQQQRANLALHCLALAGFEIYQRDRLQFCIGPTRL
jgi:hypothetical protein